MAARGSHAPPPQAARGTTCRCEKQPETGGSATTSSPFLSSPAPTCNNNRKPNKAVDFNFFLVFSDMFFLLLLHICFGFCFFLSDLASPSLFQAAGCVDVFRSTTAQLLVSDRRLQLALLLQPEPLELLRRWARLLGALRRRSGQMADLMTGAAGAAVRGRWVSSSPLLRVRTALPEADLVAEDEVC